MTSIADLPDRWPLAGHFDLRDELLAAWAEPGRRYHDRRHLAEVLDRLAELGCDGRARCCWRRGSTTPSTTAAADDEERSAAWAERALPADVGPEVARLVRMTERHRPAADDPHGQLLSDADLAILAAPGRALRRLRRRRPRRSTPPCPTTTSPAAGRPCCATCWPRTRLFHTAAARELWEDRARGNVTAELARLAPRLIEARLALNRARLDPNQARVNGGACGGAGRRVTSRETSSRDDTGVAPAASMSSYHSDGTS